MRVLVVLTVLAAVAGCGGREEPKRAAGAPTASPSPTATPTVNPVSGAERAKATLQNFLQEETQDGSGHCVPADEVARTAIAEVKCDYRDGPRGVYVLFKTRKAMRAYFNLVRATSAPIAGQPCSFRTWRRNGSTQGRFGLLRLGARKVAIWTDDSERVVGVIYSRA